MPKDTSYYDLLGVEADATPAEIRKAYRVKALKNHPDRAGNTAEATSAFQHLKAVYEVLVDADRRAEYDEVGPPSNLHGDDDAGIDMEAVAAFFRGGTRVTANLVAQFEKTYRDGAPEREDLADYFRRFEGDVRRVEEYIPYSDVSDFVRFVAFWDAQIEAGELEPGPQWKAARKALLRKGKGRERDMEAVKADEAEAEDKVEEAGSGAEQDEGAEPADAEETEVKKGKKGAKKKGKKKSSEPDMSQLAAIIQARQKRNQEEFNQWVEEKEAEDVRKSTRKSRGGRAAAEKDGAAQGGIQKKRRSRR